MANSSLQYFLLTGFVDMGALWPLGFVLTLALFSAALCLNVFLAAVIAARPPLHRPMFLLMCALFVNELYGGVAQFPFLLTQLHARVHAVPTAFCFLLIFCQYTYATIEFGTLAAMAYDRYLAICCPLQYHARMSGRKVLLLVVGVWLYAFARCSVTLSLNARLTFCGNALRGVYPRNFLIVRLACGDTRINNIYGLTGVVLSVGLPLAAIMASYVKILAVCHSGSAHTRHKALRTCTPHLLSVLNFCFGCSFDIVASRFELSTLPAAVGVAFSLYYALLQPLLTPLLYGLQSTPLRRAARGLLGGDGGDNGEGGDTGMRLKTKGHFGGDT